MTPLMTPIHIVSELSRIISLSMRLFGNVFAGEVLLATMVAIGWAVLQPRTMARDEIPIHGVVRAGVRPGAQGVGDASGGRAHPAHFRHRLLQPLPRRAHPVHVQWAGFSFRHTTFLYQTGAVQPLLRVGAAARRKGSGATPLSSSLDMTHPRE